MKTVGLLGLVLLILGVTPSRAAQWSFEPAVEGRVSYNDNISLTPNTTDRLWGFHASPRAVFAWREAVTEFAGEARLGVNRYPSNKDLDTTDLLSELRYVAASERNTYGLSGRFDRDSTLATEARRTGVVQARRQRTQKSLSPSYRRALTDRSSISLRYQYADVGYESGSGLRDYRNHSASVNYAWLASERLRADTSASWDDLQTMDDNIRTTTRSLSQGVSYGLTERITLGLNAGWRRSRTTVNSFICPFGAQIICDSFRIKLVPVARTVTGNGLVLVADADFAMDTGKYNLSLSRGTSPTGSGLTVRTDRLGLQWRGDWTERISLSASGAWLRSAYDGGLAQGARYLTVDTSLGWKLDEGWTVGASYAHVRSVADGAPGGARSNALYFTVSYQWPPISMK